ncbi:unnamed protein product (macronuclear) [Paramecium tetraurelia]|uniref:Amino acid transporter transmembrane domain-containing protein n=1 Tax=Paramecium tetraurelia TaxID=5888 RepID=A0D1S4_PARTE|nr:uncharacterized protein GSPATT00012515001 [Paramecium tetraurelia]CAK76991.1 unnamed protein product [Paramecium tetraurelia]|eukprot:XP_001444388.1 hypothetical protein (macronuclear) [Paramecium tetraurelia strain d4-2]
MSESTNQNLPSIQPLELDTSDTPNPKFAENTSKSKENKSTVSQAALNLYKCCIGSGILAAPFTFREGGYLLTSFCYFLICILMIYSQLVSMHLICRCYFRELWMKSINPIQNYVYLNKLFIIVMQWGCCASYVLFFMEFLEYAIYHHQDVIFSHQLIYLSIAMCIIIPLVFINNMTLFTKFSTIANSLIIISLIACIVYFNIELVKEVNYNDIPVARFSNLPLVIGVALFSFEAIGTLLDVRKSMQEPAKFPKLMTLVFSGCTMQFWIFGLLGSLSYGDTTNEIILFSLGNGAEAFQILYAIALIITLPLQLLPAFHLIERIKIAKHFTREGTSGFLLRRTFLRLLQVLAIAGLAIAIPQFALLISFIGGLCGAVLQFFFPLMFYLKWTWRFKPSELEGQIYICSMILGCILGLVAVADSIYEIATQ